MSATSASFMSVAKVSRAKAVLNSFGHKPCNCPSKVASKQGPSFVHFVADGVPGIRRSTKPRIAATILLWVAARVAQHCCPRQ